MKTARKNVPLTTVSVDTSLRDRINSEAERLGLSQRQMIERMMETYDLSLQHEITGPSPPIDAKSLSEMLEKVLKRDDRIVAFIKTQEAELLKPILAYVQREEAEIRILTDLIKQLQ